MGCQNNSLFIVSFAAGGDSGLAMLSAASQNDAISLLRNTGRYNGTPDAYQIIQARNIGMSTSIRSELLLESYINALVAYDAISSSINVLVGPKGDTGGQGPQGEPGPRGIDGASVIGIEQTYTSPDDDGLNEITFTLSDGTESKVYIKNGRAGIVDAEASVDATYGTPSVVVHIEDGLLSLSFSGLKGPQGNPGINNTTMRIVELPLPTASSETTQDVYLVYNSTTGDYDRYITQYEKCCNQLARVCE